MPGKCSFKDIWLEDTRIRDWLSRASDIHKARCRVCMKDFDISNMGKGLPKKRNLRNPRNPLTYYEIHIYIAKTN